MAKQGRKVPVGTRALLQRINRSLWDGDHYGGAVKTTRGEHARSEYGKYYLLDAGNTVVDSHVDLGKLARKLKVLAPHERWEGESE